MNQFNEPWGFKIYPSGETAEFFAGADRGRGQEMSVVQAWIGIPEHTDEPEAAWCVSAEHAKRIVACVNALAGVPTEDIERVVALVKVILLHQAAMTMPMPEGFAERILGMRLGGIEDLLKPDAPKDAE